MTSDVAHTSLGWDPLTDVLNVFRVGPRAATAGQAPHDNHLILERDVAGTVVGLQLLGASTRRVWFTHQDRALIPAELLRELDEWMLDSGGAARVRDAAILAAQRGDGTP